MSVIILIISSYDKPEYIGYKERWLSTIHENKNPQLRYYFLEANPSLPNPIEISENDYTIRVQEEESIIPGILKKTLKAIQYLLFESNIEFDYIYRTNLSTSIIETSFINFIDKMKRENIDYAGNREFAWKCFPFVSGSGMVLSRDACQYLCEESTHIVLWEPQIFATDYSTLHYTMGIELGYQWHDDVCIGFILTQKYSIYDIPYLYPENMENGKEHFQIRWKR